MKSTVCKVDQFDRVPEPHRKSWDDNYTEQEEFIQFNRGEYPGLKAAKCHYKRCNDGQETLFVTYIQDVVNDRVHIRSEIIYSFFLLCSTSVSL